jgi:peptidoglycan DL-endopeptidase CwlO
VHTRQPGSKTLIATLWNRAVAIPLGVVAAGLLVVFSGSVAAGAPQPTIAQVQAELNSLNAKAQILDQQYAQAQQQLSSANAQLASINAEITRDKARYSSMRKQIGRIATQAYENGSLTSPQALLMSTKPQQILNQASILQELSSGNTAQLVAFANTSKQLASAQQAAQRVSAGKLSVRNQLAAQQTQNNNLINQQKALLAQLTPAQQTTVASTGLGGGAVPAGPRPTASNAQAQAAINFAFAKIGCPYVFGGTGPCSSGYDCSGLTQSAWAAAGVSIPRTSEDQAGLPAVSTSELEVGDILEFAGDSHVGLYAGNGMLIDAPHTGLNVEEVSLSGWYSQNLDGAVRP